jgi:hypothetical protein
VETFGKDGPIYNLECSVAVVLVVIVGVGDEERHTMKMVMVVD